MEGESSGNSAPWEGANFTSSGGNIDPFDDEGQQHAQEDQFEDDMDEAYASSAGRVASQSSMSVDSTVFNYEMAHGRSYHGYRRGLYMLPNDQTEWLVEENVHSIFTELLGGRLFLSEIGESPHKIIDIGTGTGIWAIEVADQFPSASVIGTDLSPIQPTWVPPNVRMFIEDCEEAEWLHGSNFDLVHFRHSAIFIKDMDALLAKMLPHIRPGGWIEFQEITPKICCDDGSMGPDDPLRRLSDLQFDSWSRLGFSNFLFEEGIEEILQRAGFTNIHGTLIKVPLSNWSENKEHRALGMMLKRLVLDRIGAVSAKPLALLDMPEEDRESLIAGAHESLNDPNIHLYLKFWLWRAQKPGASF